MTELYKKAVELYKKEKKAGRKFGRVKIRKLFNTNSFDSVKIRIIADLLHEFGTYEELESKIHKLTKQNKVITSKYKSIIENYSETNELLQQLEIALLEKIEVLADKYFNINDKIVNNISSNDNKSEEEIVLLLSDFHIGEIVNPEVVGYLNEYNYEIAKKRVNTLIEKVKEIVEIHRNKSKIEKIHIACLGDMVSGNNLHDELDKTNEFNIADQVLYAAELISKIIYEMSKIFKEINFYGVIGNHGRATKKKEYKNPSSSYDYLAYKIVEKEILTILSYRPDLLNNIKFKSFVLNSHFIFTTICDHNILFTHGDNIKIWNNIPFYGMIREYSTKQELFLASYNQPVHYICMGHFHQPITINRPMGGIIVNGSLKGVCEYSFNKNFLSKPSQTIFGMNRKYGKTFLYELYL